MTGEELRQARRALALSEVALGRVLDVNERTIRRWERDGHNIPAPVAVLMRLALKLPAVQRELGINARGDAKDGADKRQKGRPAISG